MEEKSSRVYLMMIDDLSMISNENKVSANIFQSVVVEEYPIEDISSIIESL